LYVVVLEGGPIENQLLGGDPAEDDAGGDDAARFAEGDLTAPVERCGEADPGQETGEGEGDVFTLCRQALDRRRKLLVGAQRLIDGGAPA